ncbi:MAG: hypothetical protein ACE5FB_08405 [Candidatus Binatia bacterium]
MFVSRRRLAALVLAVFVLAQPHRLALGTDEVVILQAGTPVFIVFDHAIDSESVKEGDLVHLRVIRPVVVDDAVLIRVGEEVIAKVTEVKEAGGWGKRGDLTIRVDSTTAVDGQQVFLSGTQQREGEGKGGTATAVGVGLGLLCLPAALFGFTVHGEEGRFPIGYELKAYVDSGYKVKVAAAEQPSPAEERKRVRELQLEIEHKIQEEKRKKEEEEEKERQEQQMEEPMIH